MVAPSAAVGVAGFRLPDGVGDSGLMGFNAANASFLDHLRHDRRPMVGLRVARQSMAAAEHLRLRRDEHKLKNTAQMEG